jgi:hypothetical protein
MLGELSSPRGCCPHVAPAQMVGDHAEPGMVGVVCVALRRCAAYSDWRARIIGRSPPNCDYI